ncbi:hypothetical protein Tco_0624226 [Tanacetum coccineum]|uniref:Uncharacterized protein n=1 Tax=Tanacetum coccineum TaxID=301880 RepID=A0ABQ4WDH4_9ASTR
MIVLTVSKPTNNKVDTSTKNANSLSTKEVANGVIEQPNVPLKVCTNDSVGSTNEHGYFKDDVDIGQLRSAFGKLMEENKVLDVITTI